MAFSFDNVQTNPVDAAPLVLLFAPNGHGKTSFILSSNNPFVIDTENKYQKTTVQRYVPNTFQDVIDCLVALYNCEKFPGGCLAIDTVDWLEKRIHESMCRTYKKKDGSPASSINEPTNEALNYGKGSVVAANEFNSHILTGLMAIRDKHNIPIILCCQTAPVGIKLPDQDEYKVMNLRLDKHLAGFISDVVEAKMYIQCRYHKNFKDAMIPSKERYLITVPQKGIAAKNSLHLPDEIIIGEYTGWNDFAAARDTNKAIKE